MQNEQPNIVQKREDIFSSTALENLQVLQVSVVLYHEHNQRIMRFSPKCEDARPIYSVLHMKVSRYRSQAGGHAAVVDNPKLYVYLF